jgi:hypothetical protein
MAPARVGLADWAGWLITMMTEDDSTLSRLHHVLTGAFPSMFDAPLTIDDIDVQAGPGDALQQERRARAVARALERPFARRYTRSKSRARRVRRSSRKSRKKSAEAPRAAAFARAEAVRDRVNAIDPAVAEDMLMALCLTDPTFVVANVPD